MKVFFHIFDCIIIFDYWFKGSLKFATSQRKHMRTLKTLQHPITHRVDNIQKLSLEKIPIESTRQVTQIQCSSPVNNTQSRGRGCTFGNNNKVTEKDKLSFFFCHVYTFFTGPANYVQKSFNSESCESRAAALSWESPHCLLPVSPACLAPALAAGSRWLSGSQAL